jgi:hypothetical protein
MVQWFDVPIASQGVRLIGEGSSGYSFFILTRGSAAVTTNEGTLTVSAIAAGRCRPNSRG